MGRKRGRNEEVIQPSSNKEVCPGTCIQSCSVTAASTWGGMWSTGWCWEPTKVSEFLLIVITKLGPVSRAKIAVAFQSRPTGLASKTVLSVTSASLKITNATQAPSCLPGDRCN